MALFAGPLAAVAIWLALGRHVDPAGLSAHGKITLAIAAWMGIWWVTEAVELEATALLPLILFPAAGVLSMKAAAAPYADPTIFFFMGGMMLGAAMERWGLPRRFALHVLLRSGGSPSLLILGAMTATAIVSMWINNTSTCIMMLPIGMSVARLIEAGVNFDGKPDARRGMDNFSTAMVLGVAYSATIGGIGTLFGTAPNIILQSTVKKLANEDLGFIDYALVGTPIMALYLPAAWAVLIWLYPPTIPSASEARGFIKKELESIGPMRGAEKCVLAALGVAVALWALVSPLNDALNGWLGRKSTDPQVLSEAGIGIMVAIVLFLIPAREADGTRTTVLNWKHAITIQWGVLVLFGGGLALAEAMTQTGVNTYLGEAFKSLRDVPPFFIVLAITTLVCFASEIASNTAIATTFLPVAYTGAKALGIHPYVLMFPVALAASYAFMMPMGTPPNALAIATGRVRIGQMVKAGVVLNIIAIALISTYITLVAPLIERTP